jgi:hypothetical protein
MRWRSYLGTVSIIPISAKSEIDRPIQHEASLKSVQRRSDSRLFDYLEISNTNRKSAFVVRRVFPFFYVFFLLYSWVQIE